MKWKRISSLPENDYDILVAWDSGIIEMMTVRSAEEYIEPKIKDGGYLTHWMPLPRAPNIDAIHRKKR